MTEAEKKRAFINAMADMPDSVVTLAFAYAQDMFNYGVDVTEKWDTVAKQHEALSTAYRSGKHDGETLRRFRALDCNPYSDF